MASDKITPVELESIRLIESKPLKITSEHTFDMEENVRTRFGPVHVVVQGDRKHPAILTFHDIGLNSTSCFSGFFNYSDMQPIVANFCLYHVNAIGQEENAPTLPQGLGLTEQGPLTVDYQYPSMDDLASTVGSVVEYFNLKSIIGFGVGAGANVLSRFALTRPEKMDALILVNANASKVGWTEWAYQKWNSWYLRSGAMTSSSEEYLIWHWFGNKTNETNQDLLTVFMEYVKSINPTNLGFFITSYINRTDLEIVRELDPFKKNNVKNFTCPVMLVAGDNSPHLDDTIEMNGRLDPSNSTWMKFMCGGMILEEVPGKFSEAMRLFLQGLGFIPHIRQRSQSHVDGFIPSITDLTGSNRRYSAPRPQIV